MENLKLVMFLFIFCIRGSSTQSLPCHTASGDNCPSSICPNTTVSYTCTISGTPGGATDWILPSGTCTNSTDRIILSQVVSQGCSAVGSRMCGPYYRADSIMPSSGTLCLSSTLTVNIVADVDGNVVRCNNTNAVASQSTVVSMTTINVVASPGPVGDMTVISTSVNQLTVTWTPPTTGGVPTSYNVTINDTSNSLISIQASGLLQYTFTNLIYNTLYTVSVVAINCAGSSSRASLTKGTLALPPTNTTIKALPIFNSSNVLLLLNITWTPVGGAVTIYGVYVDGGIHGNTTCTSSHCFYVVPVSVSYTSYVISVASVNKDGFVGPNSTTTIYVPLPPDNTTIKVLSAVFNPNNTLRHLEITWIPVGGAVIMYKVFINDIFHGNTNCTTLQCFYVVPVSVSSTIYVSVTSVTKDGYVGPKSTTTIYGVATINTVVTKVTSITYATIATVVCSMNDSYYCGVCCSTTDPSVPPYSTVSSISTTRGTEVTVSLQGLTSGQMYYCKAAATNTNVNNCTGSVVGGVKLYFTLLTTNVIHPSPPYWIIAIVVGVILLAVIVAIVVVVIYKKKSSKGGLKNAEDTAELPVKKGGTLPVSPSDGTGGALYQDPKAIEHVKAPGGEMYAMADKTTEVSTKTSEKATKKPTTAITHAAGMYQDPKDIQHTTTQAGETYAMTDKKPTKPVDHVKAPTGDMYAIAAGANKQPKKKT